MCGYDYVTANILINTQLVLATVSLIMISYLGRVPQFERKRLNLDRLNQIADQYPYIILSALFFLFDDNLPYFYHHFQNEHTP